MVSEPWRGGHRAAARLRQIFLQREGIGHAGGIARRYASEARGLEMPLAARRQPPGAIARIGGVPAHRLVLDIHHLVMRVEQLDAMPVGLAEIDEQRMPRGASAGSVLQVSAEAERARDVAGLENAMRLSDREGHVVEARAGPVGENDVVRIALALQEHEP